MHVDTINAAYAFLSTPEGRALSDAQAALARRFRARRPHSTVCRALPSNLLPMAEFLATRDAIAYGPRAPYRV